MGFQIINDSYPFLYLNEYDYIILVCDLYGDMKGLYSKILTHKYPNIIPKIRERYGDTNKLGTFDIIESDKYKAKVILLYCITTPPSSNIKNLSKKYLKLCLYELNKFINDKGIKIISNVFGTQLSEGKNDENEILNIVDVVCKDIEIVLCRFNNIAYYNLVNDIKNFLKYFQSRNKNVNLYYFMNSDYVLDKLLERLDLPQKTINI